jgi:hypothetical protein
METTHRDMPATYLKTEGSVEPVDKTDAYVTDHPAQDVALRPLVKDSFSYLSVFSLAFSCINSWVAIVYGLSAGLNSGGPTACEWASDARTDAQWCGGSSTGRDVRWPPCSVTAKCSQSSPRPGASTTGPPWSARRGGEPW